MDRNAVDRQMFPPKEEFPDEIQLWRGFRREILTFPQMLGPVSNRAPKKTPPDTHKICDEWFLKEFGIRFRSEALFCNGDPQVAAHYGNVYSVIPFAGFKFCWSPKVRDLYVELDLIFSNSKFEIVDFLFRADYQSTNLSEAVDSGCEIMIAAKGFCILNR